MPQKPKVDPTTARALQMLDFAARHIMFILEMFGVSIAQPLVFGNEKFVIQISERSPIVQPKKIILPS